MQHGILDSAQNLQHTAVEAGAPSRPRLNAVHKTKLAALVRPPTSWAASLAVCACACAASYRNAHANAVLSPARPGPASSAMLQTPSFVAQLALLS